MSCGLTAARRALVLVLLVAKAASELAAGWEAERQLEMKALISGGCVEGASGGVEGGVGGGMQGGGMAGEGLCGGLSGDGGIPGGGIGAMSHAYRRPE
eukprot:4959554-Pleurochrysis_carterae.AAC.2